MNYSIDIDPFIVLSDLKKDDCFTYKGKLYKIILTQKDEDGSYHFDTGSQGISPVTVVDEYEKKGDQYVVLKRIKIHNDKIIVRKHNPLSGGKRKSRRRKSRRRKSTHK